MPTVGNCPVIHYVQIRLVYLVPLTYITSSFIWSILFWPQCFQPVGLTKIQVSLYDTIPPAIVTVGCSKLAKPKQNSSSCFRNPTHRKQCLKLEQRRKGSKSKTLFSISLILLLPFLLVFLLGIGRQRERGNLGHRAHRDTAIFRH